MGMIKHFQITQSNKFTISWQYLEKDVKNGGHICHANKRQSFYKLALSFLMEVTIHVQNTQNLKFVIFLQYILQKIVSTVFYCDAKHSDILWWFIHGCCCLFCIIIKLHKLQLYRALLNKNNSLS